MSAVISEFSSTILNPFDLQQLLEMLTGHAVALTGSQGAGVMLAGRREGKLRFAAASDERALEMELIQDRIEAGACYEAFLHNQLMVIEDLEISGRWPAYEHRAEQSGVRAVLAVPMNAWGETIGVVSIYRDEPGPWSHEDVEAAQIITSMGSGYVLHANRIRAQHDLADQLQGALESRDLIGQAKGILMARGGVDAGTAFDQLRTVSQQQNVKLREVARKVVKAGAASDHRTVNNGSAPMPGPAAAPRAVDLLGSTPDVTDASVGSTRPADRALQRGSEAAQTRDQAARLREESATTRDEAAQQRDEVADRRDAESDLREHAAAAGGPDPSHAQADETCQNTASRDRSAAGKDRTAERVDAVAAYRDQRADDRDRAAEERDREARTVVCSAEHETVIDVRCRADLVAARDHAASDRRASAQDRLRAAHGRTAAGVDRDASAGDRVASAGDRRHAAQDRDASAADRAEATEELNAASLDALTGTYTRGPGMAELERDHSRAGRTGEPLTLAFVDVDDLTGTNDRDGHPAGDRLLRQVAEVLTEHIRPHDVIIRYGGDEFICALVGPTRTEAAERLKVVNAALADASERGSITAGLAELEPDESLTSLIRRADADLYHQRRHRSQIGPQPTRQMASSHTSQGHDSQIWPR